MSTVQYIKDTNIVASAAYSANFEQYKFTVEELPLKFNVESTFPAGFELAAPCVYDITTATYKDNKEKATVAGTSTTLPFSVDVTRPEVAGGATPTAPSADEAPSTDADADDEDAVVEPKSVKKPAAEEETGTMEHLMGWTIGYTCELANPATAEKKTVSARSEYIYERLDKNYASAGLFDLALSGVHDESRVKFAYDKLSATLGFSTNIPVEAVRFDVPASHGDCTITVNGEHLIAPQTATAVEFVPGKTFDEDDTISFLVPLTLPSTKSILVTSAEVTVACPQKTETVYQPMGGNKDAEAIERVLPAVSETKTLYFDILRQYDSTGRPDNTVHVDVELHENQIWAIAGGAAALFVVSVAAAFWAGSKCNNKKANTFL